MWRRSDRAESIWRHANASNASPCNGRMTNSTNIPLCSVMRATSPLPHLHRPTIRRNDEADRSDRGPWPLLNDGLVEILYEQISHSESELQQVAQGYMSFLIRFTRLWFARDTCRVLIDWLMVAKPPSNTPVSKQHRQSTYWPDFDHTRATGRNCGL